MSNSEARRIIDAIIFMVCEEKTAKEIAEALRVNEKAVKAVVSKLDIIRF